MKTAVIIIAVIAVIILIYLAATYNSLVKLRNSVEEAFATMDVYLKKRWDLIRILLPASRDMRSMRLKLC